MLELLANSLQQIICTLEVYLALLAAFLGFKIFTPLGDVPILINVGRHPGRIHVQMFFSQSQGNQRGSGD